MYMIADMSFGSSVGAGHLRMMGYSLSGKMGSGRSWRYFFSKTAAR